MFDIVMALFNKENYVARTIESALGQTFTRWRLLVVDDASTDRSAEVVQGFDDSRITLITQANAGPGAARNRGIRAGSSEWIAFLDADDVWLPDHLQVLDSIRRRFPEASLIGTGFVPWQGEDDVREEATSDEGGRLVRYFREVAEGRPPFFTSSAAFARAAVGRVGLLKPVMMEDETEFWARLALDGPVASSRRKTVLYRVGTGGLTDRWTERDRRALPSLRREDVSLTIAPVLAQLEKGAEPELKKDLEDFVDYDLGLSLMRALRAGDVAYGRNLLKLFIHGPRGNARVAAVLTKLPGRVGQRLLFLIFAMKGFLRALRKSSFA